MLRRFLRKALKKDSVMLRKTDDEVIRYMKQTAMIEERKRYEELMEKERKKKE